jgi:hypothetical protein
VAAGRVENLAAFKNLRVYRFNVDNEVPNFLTPSTTPTVFLFAVNKLGEQVILPLVDHKYY